jgi:hypothetical protein
MASYLSRISTAARAAIYAWRDVFAEPDAAALLPSQEERRAYFRLLWDYYRNSCFDDAKVYAAYKSRYGLYRHTRPLYNPTQRLVDFYAGQVYPGVLSADAKRLPDGVPLAVPFNDDIPDELAAAIAQLWQWSNWQAQSKKYVRFGAACGSVLVEVADEAEKGKVTFEPIYAGRVESVRLSSAGDLEAYALDFYARDDAGGLYRYRKEADKQAIRVYRDEKLEDERENFYGFVPAVWVKHADLGDDYGAPALRSSVGKIDELNSLVSHIHDHIHSRIKAPLVLWSDGRIKSLFAKAARGEEQDDVEQTDDTTLMLKGPAGGSLSTLAGDVDLGAAFAYAEKLIEEVEKDHPELKMFEELRGMSAVTGPAASRLLGDVSVKYWEAAANYDLGSIKLFQMGVAIMGERLRRGDVVAPTEQQRKFAPFDLTSYRKGQLDLTIKPRPLIPVTAEDAAGAEQKRAVGVAAIADFISNEEALRKLGYNESQILQIGQERRAQIKAEEIRAER